MRPSIWKPAIILIGTLTALLIVGLVSTDPVTSKTEDMVLGKVEPKVPDSRIGGFVSKGTPNRPPEMVKHVQAQVPPSLVPKPEQFDPGMVDEPGYRTRMRRHIAVKHLLQSPALGTPECQQIMQLCRDYGLEPWATGPVYNIAWEASVAIKIWEKNVNNWPPEAQAVFLELRRDESGRLVEEVKDRFGVDLPPEMVKQVKEIVPDVFFGPLPVATREEMLDRVGWDDPRLKIGVN